MPARDALGGFVEQNDAQSGFSEVSGGPGNFVVVYDPDAVRELQEIRDKRLRTAVFTAVEKLRVLGPKTIEPHSRKVQGANTLRELRPRGGRYTVRPLYVQRDEREYVILAIAPEAMEDPSGFRASVERARDRARSRYGIDVCATLMFPPCLCDNTGDIVRTWCSPVTAPDAGHGGTAMTRPSARDRTTHGQIVAEEVNTDAEFRQEWERLALARTVAAEVIRYRADHGLSQRGLARTLGIRQPQVARLENAEHNPSHDTLVMLASRLGFEFNISISPADKAPTLLTKKGREDATACIRADDAVVRFNARRQACATRGHPPPGREHTNSGPWSGTD